MACHTRPVRCHSTPITAIAVAALATFAVAGGLTACSRDQTVESDAERFCGEAIAQTSLIVAPPLATEAELQATLEFYRLMGELAPVAIAEEWNDLVVNLETAATVVPGDPESEQRVATTAYATEPSAFRVKTWLRDNCGVDIPITTIAPQEQVPARTTTTTSTPSGG
jgi:hypothetical protein